MPLDFPANREAPCGRIDVGDGEVAANIEEVTGSDNVAQRRKWELEIRRLTLAGNESGERFVPRFLRSLFPWFQPLSFRLYRFSFSYVHKPVSCVNSRKLNAPAATGCIQR